MYDDMYRISREDKLHGEKYNYTSIKKEKKERKKKLN